MAPAGDKREIAMAKRDKTFPRPKPAEVVATASSSSRPPPPPPGAGAVKKVEPERFNIAKKTRPQTATRPLVPQPQISGVKRKAEDQGGVRGRPNQPAVPSSARRTKRKGAPLLRPGRPSQPADPSLDDLWMPRKRKKVDTPPRRVNQKKSTKVQWSQPRANTKWSKVVAR